MNLDHSLSRRKFQVGLVPGALSLFSRCNEGTWTGSQGVTKNEKTGNEVMKTGNPRIIDSIISNIEKFIVK